MVTGSRPWKGRRVKRWQVVLAGTVLLVVIAGAAAGLWYVRTMEPRLRRELEVRLSERLNSDVAIESLSVRLYPSVYVEGTGLVLRIKDRADLPPFVTVRKFTGTGSLADLRVRRLDEMRLEGAAINVPPGRKRDLQPLRVGAGSAGARRDSRAPLVSRLVADAVTITVLPRDADRDPVVWDVRELEVRDFSLDAVSPFSATVDTPLPADRAKVSGTAGPWPRGDFGNLPMTGQFTFDGDLAAIAGMDGHISVSGDVLGPLERLATTGTASSTRLGLRSGAAGQLPMKAIFDAAFDGTSGDLYLTRVATTLGGAAFETSGQVLRKRGVRGRYVSLAVKTPGQVELAELLQLLIDGRWPPLSGRLAIDARITIPPGDRDLLERLTADGTFRVSNARFANAEVQAKVDDLSRRGQGRPRDLTIARVGSSMRGRVSIEASRLTLRNVHFEVPGVAIDAAGGYSLVNERMNFRGVARLDARMSRTQTGAKRVLLRPLDPLLSKDGAGTRVVLDISGTRNAPAVDIDFGASLRGRR
jgi:hypothetical protein